MKRKDFFKMAGRGTLAAAITATGISYARRKPISEDKCDLKSICHRCGKTTTCNLPHAQAYREHQSRKANL